MGYLIARPRNATHNITIKTSAVVAGFKVGDGNVIYLQFPTKLPAGATITSAVVAMEQTAGQIITPGTKAKWYAVEYFGDGMDATVESATKYASATYDWPSADSDDVITFDVTSRLTVAKALGGWNGMLTLALEMTTPPTGQVVTFTPVTSQWLDAPRATIVFEYANSTLDPYTIMLRSLWAMLEADTGFASLVAPRNRIKFDDDDDRDPSKDVPAEGDRPEVMIVMSGGTPHARATSSSSFDAAKFTIYVSTGDQRAPLYYPVRWAIYRALAGWATALPFIKWNSKVFAVQPVQGAVTESLDDEALNRATRGWSAVWECEVQLTFTTADL